MTEKQPAIAFIGGGNMATSIIGGLVNNGYPADRIWASDPVEESRDRLASSFGINTTADNNLASSKADVIVLAVKPQVMKIVTGGIASSIQHGPVIASIAAGIPVAALADWLGTETAIVRCMPNTPALVHQGASGLFANTRVSASQKAMVENLFSAVGLVSWLDTEAEIDAVTALSGSGPAYFFLLIEAMEKAGVELGLCPRTARQLALKTALGAATMAIQSDVDAAELRRRVTSPGGTTERAILTFNDGDFAGLVAKAMAAASTRAAEMADEFSH
jgi:pyrroline-5-carboxylate reductase